MSRPRTAEFRRRLYTTARDAINGAAGRQTVSVQWKALLSSGRISVGRHSYGMPSVQVVEGETGQLRIGSFTSISTEVLIMLGGNHRPDWVTTFPIRQVFKLPGAFQDGHPTSKGPVTVGSDVWIGRGARILSGVSIGHGAVVGAQAVVARDVRPYAVVVGNSAREIKRRFSEEVVESLLRIAWWDWDDATILERVDELCCPDVEAFCALYDPAWNAKSNG